MTQHMVASNESATAGRPLSVLYVEDHADTLEVIGRLFTAQGYSVHLADCCKQARQISDSLTHLDVLVADIGLPDGSGIDLLGELLERWPHLCAIALTAYGMKVDIEKTLAAGFNRHLTKPVSFEKILQTIVEVTSSPCR